MPVYKTWSLDLKDLRQAWNAKTIIPDPDWQRGYVWNGNDEKLLIDSLLREIPLPYFFVTREYDSKSQKIIDSVIDGQQRLTAIYRFLTNEFPIYHNNIDTYFQDLSLPEQNKLLSVRLNGWILDNGTTSDIRFLFQRLNSTGVSLNNMEIRNATYAGTNIMKLIHRIYYDSCFFPKSPNSSSAQPNTNLMNASILALVRYIYTDDNIIRKVPIEDISDICNCIMTKSIQGGAKPFIDRFWINNNNIPDKIANELYADFNKTVKKLANIFATANFQDSLWTKRTHFWSLFLAVNTMMRDSYIDTTLLINGKTLGSALQDFIDDMPTEYSDVVKGAIKHKSSRETRVKCINLILTSYATKRDTKRSFASNDKDKLWSQMGTTKICPLCKKGMSGKRETAVDHIIPWAKGGKTILENAQLTHKKCNEKKSDKLMDEYCN